MVIKACKEAGVARLMFCSSVSVIFDGRDLLNITEDDVTAPPYTSGFHYAMTKRKAERLVLNANGTYIHVFYLYIFDDVAIRLY